MSRSKAEDPRVKVPAAVQTDPGRADERPAPIVHRGGLSHWVDQITSRFTVVAVWIVLMVIYAILEPAKFLQVSTLQSIFGSEEPILFLALAALCALLVGEFDLSIASVLGLAATVLPVLSTEHGMSPWTASLVALAVAIACGLLHAFIVVVVGVDGFIVTLGSSTFLLGVTLLLSNSTTVFGIGQSFSKIALSNLLGLPLSFYYGLALTLFMGYVVTFTPMGRHLTFVGASREVARLAGIRVDRIRFLSYVASSTIAGIGGILMAAQLGGFDPTSSTVYLLPALSAVFLGTAVVQPGRANPLGTFIGVYFLATGIFGLQLFGLGGWIQQVFYGGVMVLAVAVASIVRRRRGGTAGSATRMR